MIRSICNKCDIHCNFWMGSVCVCGSLILCWFSHLNWLLMSFHCYQFRHGEWEIEHLSKSNGWFDFIITIHLNTFFLAKLDSTTWANLWPLGHCGHLWRFIHMWKYMSKWLTDHTMYQYHIPKVEKKMCVFVSIFIAKVGEPHDIYIYTHFALCSHSFNRYIVCLCVCVRASFHFRISNVLNYEAPSCLMCLSHIYREIKNEQPMKRLFQRDHHWAISTKNAWFENRWCWLVSVHTNMCFVSTFRHVVYIKIVE